MHSLYFSTNLGGNDLRDRCSFVVAIIVTVAVTTIATIVVTIDVTADATVVATIRAADFRGGGPRPTYLISEQVHHPPTYHVIPGRDPPPKICSPPQAREKTSCQKCHGADLAFSRLPGWLGSQPAPPGPGFFKTRGLPLTCRS